MNSSRGRGETPTAIRVLFANLTGMVAEIIQQAFQQHSDINVLGNFEEWEKVHVLIAETDVLILGVNDVYSLPENCFQLLSNYPNLKILLLATTHDAAIAYWRSLHCHQIHVTSSRSLIESVREIYLLSPR